MGFEVKEFTNMGMKQDASPSKHEENFAFENHNIRITAVGDSTLLSVTNEKGPKKIETKTFKKYICNPISFSDNNTKIVLKYPTDVDITIGISVCDKESGIVKNRYSYTIQAGQSDKIIVGIMDSEYAVISDIYYTDSKYRFMDIQDYTDEYSYEEVGFIGEYIGHCIINNYLVIFTHNTFTNQLDYIYRYEFNDNILEGILLYSGNLNLSNDYKFEALPYHESEEVQKVYWVDGVNSNKVINIKNEFIPDNSDLSFTPEIELFPDISVSTLHNGCGRFTSGIIQYFVTYYNKYGAETKIVGLTDLINISPVGRGGKVNEHCDCSFDIRISNLDTKFEYIRVYSAQRTSLDGPLEIHIVKDIKLSSSEVTINDDNVNQQTVDNSLIYFIGGSDFIASTLCQKNDTLFLGNISIENTDLSEDDKLKIKNTTIKEDSSNNYLKCNCVQVISTTIEGNNWVFGIDHKYFDVKYLKANEYYRLAIQYQDNKGNWTSPVWIGDIKHDKHAVISVAGLSDLGYAYIPKTIFRYPSKLSIDSRYKKYRILRAKTDYNNRSTITQGILCPTVFNYEERYNNKPFSIASWIMRPYGDNSSFRHLEGIMPQTEIQSVIENQEPPKVQALTSTSKVILIFAPVPDYNNKGEFMVVRIPPNTTPITCSKKDVTVLYGVKKFDRTEGAYNELCNDMEALGVDLTLYLKKDEFLNKDPYYWGYPWTTGYMQDPSLESHIPWGYLQSTPAVYQYADAQGSYDNFDVVQDVINKKNNFYIDNNIVTMHSPDIDNLYDILENSNLKLRIVGCASVDDYICESRLETSTAGVGNKNDILQTRVAGEPLLADFLYRDYKLLGNSYESDVKYNYKVHLWNKENSISGWEKGAKVDGNNKDFENPPAKLKHKIFANYRISNWTSYIKDPIIYSSVNPIVFNSDEITTKVLKVKDKTTYYYGNYDKLLTPDEYKVSTKEMGIDESSNALTTTDSIRIKYKSTPHIVLCLPDDNILPLKYSDSYNLSDIYSESNVNSLQFPWENMDFEYKYTNLPSSMSFKKFMYIAELYRDIEYESVYGGHSDEDLEKIKWIPASEVTNIVIYGDTYFGQWECLKTYPFTEEDTNSVVDITRVFIEGFINFAGRSDVNTDSNNMLNARPTNFNIFNDVYNQEDNIFTYYILDEKFNVNKFENQIVWSLTKTPNDYVDSWTNATLSSVLNLDGSYGKITKLLNVNDNIIAFQDKAISTILYNERVQLSTESGLPVEIQNSGKVTGYQYVSNKTGCSNKYTIAESLAGVYYIDDYNKSFNRFGKDGVVDISALGMNVWFKKNDIAGLRSYYDSITHDVYLISSTKALLFNEDLKSFTSFMDYLGSTHIINLGGKSLIMGNKQSKFYEMFKGDYGIGLDGNSMDYSIEYVLNPEPMVDKIFTNVELTADVVNPNQNVHSPYSQSADGIPFDKLYIWNDYQRGELDLEKEFKGTLSKRFKSWRIQIPRAENSKFKHDRIRSPWAHLTLYKSCGNNTNKMVFNNLTVKYYK